MKKILGLIFVLASIGNAHAGDDEYQKGWKEEEQSKAYIACAFYADLTNPAYGKTAMVPVEDKAKFSKAALQHYKKALPYFQASNDADDITIGYAEFLASTVSILWDKPGLEKGNTAQSARAYYNESNCQLLLDSIK